MAPKPYLSITLITFMLIMASTATARPVAKREDSPSTTAESLVHRLKLDEETGYCWDSLIELQHCTGELIMFFLNGETYIGPGCCRAIRTVGQKCWPNMMGVLGFTAQEGDMLQGYCDENDHDDDDGSNDHSPPSPPTLPSTIFKPTNVRSSNP